MADLNSRQKEAVRYIDGPLLVLAGAGSGKTSVITRKIAWLIRDCGIDAGHIAAVTFTNKAAREMKSRVAGLLSNREGRGLRVSTFHTLGLDILRQDGAALGYRRGFSILDADDTVALVRDLMKRELSTDSGITEQVLWQISRWKNALVTREQLAAAPPTNPIEAVAARLYDEYQRSLKAYNAVDFDDLIVQPVRLFAEHPDILDRWQNRIRHLLVDEYQDTNASQYQLVRQIVGPRGALTVVGDDDQSIYAWRGARPENLAQLQQDYPRLKLIKLEQNYRSTGRILKAANTLIANNPHNFEKKLWSELGYGDPIKVMRASDEEHEAERVVSQLLHHKFTQRTEFRDYAILYRGNFQSRAFERALREQRIPYFLSGGTSFFERGEIKDIMAYLRLITNPDDNNAFLRIVNTPRREIGPATLEKLAEYAGERGISLYAASFELGMDQRLGERPLAMLRRFTHWISSLEHNAQDGEPLPLVHEVIKETGYEDWLKESCNDLKTAERRMENVLELVAWIERLTKPREGEEPGEDKTLTQLVADMTLIGMLDRNGDDNTGDCVSLMTLHAAKGLEFPHVFIVGMEEALLPHRSSLEGERAGGEDEEIPAANAGLEEERRLAYVGITRARQTLTFSFAQSRKRYGEVVGTEPSRFLLELPQDDLQWEGAQLDEKEKQQRGSAHLANLRNLLG